MRRIVSSLLVVLLAITLLPTLQISAATAARPLYRMSVFLHYAEARLDVQQTVIYTNRSGKPLDSIVFNVPVSFWGAVTLDGAAVAGQSVTPQFKNTILTVPLPAALPADSATEIDLSYRVRVADTDNYRFTSRGGIIALGNWFPTVAVLGGGPALVDNRPESGWYAYPYTDTGDAFYTEASDFEVSLESDTPVSVAPSGTIISQSGTRWVMRGEGLRDFGMAISNRYAKARIQVGRTTVYALYLPQHASAGQTMLQAGANALDWYNSHVGLYPYSTLYLAETLGGNIGLGQEYPGLVFVTLPDSGNGGGSTGDIAYVTTHEVGHQWFYAMVGNDQIRDAWLDEALVTETALLSFRDRYPAAYPGMWAARIIAGYNRLIAAGLDRPVNGSIYDYSDENIYFEVVYRKGALFFDDLRTTLGDAAYFDLLQRYFTTFKDGIARPSSFLDMAEQQAQAQGGSIYPLIRRYFSYPKYGDNPIQAQVRIPQNWHSIVNIALPAGNWSRVSVYLDGRPVVATPGQGQMLQVDSTAYLNDEYIITVVLGDASGRTMEWNQRVRVGN